MTIINQNYIQKEIKRGLNMGKICYHSVQHLLSSFLLSKILQMKTHRAIILLIVLYGCETWSFTLLEEQTDSLAFWTLCFLVILKYWIMVHQFAQGQMLSHYSGSYYTASCLWLYNTSSGRNLRIRPGGEATALCTLPETFY